MQTLDAMPENPPTGESRPRGSDRVLVAQGSTAEDDSLAGWLEREGFDVVSAADAEEALLIAGSSWQPDVVLLDPTLPGVDRFSDYEQFRARSRAAVIFVLGEGSETDEVRNLEAGADDYVGKHISPEVLLARMRAHLRSRQASGNQRILQPGDFWMDTKNYAVSVKGEWVELRPQEFRLLIALAQSSGVSRQELVRRAGTTWRGVSSRTVDMNISRIRAFVEAPSDGR